MKPLAHWNRDNEPDFQKVIDGLDTTTTAAAVFDNLEAAEEFTKAVREADLGLSINISTSVDGADACCHAAGIQRHSVGYSLGFEGKTEHLPNGDVLTLSTMCGHGMVSTSLAKKMIDWVKEGRRTPEQAVSRTEPVLLVRRVQSRRARRGCWKRRGSGRSEASRPDARHRARHRRGRMRRRDTGARRAPASAPAADVSS